MAKEQYSCVQPAKGPIGVSETDDSMPLQEKSKQERYEMLARVGKPAPDFEATAYTDGAFKIVKLSDYKGKWVTLCFYPGDFTFV